MVCIHLKRGVQASLNYYLLPKLYVKLWLCPSVNLIYMHSFPQSRLLYLSPWKNACCPGCVPDHHENGRCISRSCILNVFVFVFSYCHSCYYIRIVHFLLCIITLGIKEPLCIPYYYLWNYKYTRHLITHLSILSRNIHCFLKCLSFTMC